jgi:hypothetical protein
MPITTFLALWVGLLVGSILPFLWYLSDFLLVLLGIATLLTSVFVPLLLVGKSWDVLQEYIKTTTPIGPEKSTDFGGEELSSNAM